MVDDPGIGRARIDRNRDRVAGAKGAHTRAPHVDTLSKDSKYPNMKELRVQHAGKPYRIAFAFDPRQMAILLIGGIKSGKKWTSKLVALADKIYEEYLRQLKKEGLI
jgi:hypothetical protein